MSDDLLGRLHDANALDATPVHTRLFDLHVPFDQLVDGSGGDGPWEARTRSAVLRGERVAVVGQTGEGKSSLIEYVLGPLVEGLAPVPVAIGLEQPAVVTDPAAFAEHVVGRVRRFVRRSLPSAGGQVESRSGGSTSVRFGLPSWMPLNVELTRELSSVVDDEGSAAADHVETVRTLLSVVEDAGLQPVLLLDDTDKWLRTSEGDPDRGLRENFFGPVLRLIAEHLGCAAVIAVHPSYLDDEAYGKAATAVGTTVHLPRLPSVRALGAVLAHREDIALDRPAGASTGWASDGIGALFDHYGAADLRRTLAVAHTSLAQAFEEGAERIDERHVEWARRELRP